ncbi:type IV pilin protein [Synechococcus sp. RSCCF101]|uniref:type IV pilin protein n=1 Tax=Synechococcus sp. RSCCF101 TaxID=2511069 RepID=UPI001CD9B759|nr:prepilin-type N-terminal cleavage/methylation domain-containing protein [Synechococcus sp. RSCCF101]
MLLQRAASRSSANSAFTLVELIIVVAIIGVLSAVAIPQFLGVRDRAEAKANIGESMGLAKECAALNVGREPVTSVSGTDCGGPNGTAATFTPTWSATLDAADNVTCMDADITGTSATISVSADGAITCAN